MRKLLALIALSFVVAIAGGISSSATNASPLTSAVHSLKAKQTGVVEKAYYRRHYRRVARRHYRRAYYYGYNYGYAYRPAYYYGGVHYRHHRRVHRRVHRRHY